MKTKKLLSILLALMMMLSVVPFYASAAEALAVKNVSQWPTISYKTEQEFLYYGQKVSDFLEINDDEVVLNASGEQVEGHFEFNDPNEIPNGISDKMRANIKFVPDSDTYTGFVRRNCPNVTFKVIPTMPVLVNDAPTATAVDSGSTLSASVISGGQMMNPYYPEDTKVLNATWCWTDPNQAIYESGEYEATLYINTYYEVLTRMIYVEVNSTVKGTTISELPIIEEFEYTPGLTFSEVELIGGKAVEYGTDIEVPGTFSVKNPDWMFSFIGSYDIDVIFTPEDTESYTASECTVSVNVNKRSYKFVNENGEEIVPEITLPYGAKFDRGDTLGVTLRNMIKDRSSLSGADAPFISFPDHDTEEIAPVGTNTYTVRIYPSHEGNSSYQTTYREFILTIEPVVITTTASWGTDGVISGKLSHKAKGTLDIFVDGKLVADDIKAGGANNEWSVDYPIPATGDYTIKVVYNPTENDPYSMVDFEKVVTAKIRRSITYADPSAVNHKINGDERTPIATLGDTIELSTFGGVAFLGWKITDMNGNEVDLGIADLMATEITFTMPDYDLFVEAMYQKDEPADDNGGLDIDNIFGNLGDLTEGDSDNEIINIFNNLIALFKNIIEKITGFFRAIGDRT